MLLTWHLTTCWMLVVVIKLNWFYLHNPRQILVLLLMMSSDGGEQWVLTWQGIQHWSPFTATLHQKLEKILYTIIFIYFIIIYEFNDIYFDHVNWMTLRVLLNLDYAILKILIKAANKMTKLRLWKRYWK